MGATSFRPTPFANILTSGLLGEQYLGLDPGGEDKLLAAGDVIKKTQSAVVLEKLISQFMFSKVGCACKPSKLLPHTVGEQQQRML
jgi:phospholipid/cholesterol/gamma-HCH transport system substrate-binding protein